MKRYREVMPCYKFRFIEFPMYYYGHALPPPIVKIILYYAYEMTVWEDMCVLHDKLDEMLAFLDLQGGPEGALKGLRHPQEDWNLRPDQHRLNTPVPRRDRQPRDRHVPQAQEAKVRLAAPAHGRAGSPEPRIRVTGDGQLLLIYRLFRAPSSLILFWKDTDNI